MNEIFDFKRFWTYFKYDLKQMWRNHSKAAIMIGGASAIFYVIWVLCSLVFAQHWSSPVIYARIGVFFLAFTILELYMVRAYGYLTEKKAGSSWLMIPASKAEKFVSMILMVCIVIPLLFFVAYALIDGVLALVENDDRLLLYRADLADTGSRGFYAIDFVAPLGELLERDGGLFLEME